MNFKTIELVCIIFMALVIIGLIVAIIAISADPTISLFAKTYAVSTLSIILASAIGIIYSEIK